MNLKALLPNFAPLLPEIEIRGITDDSRKVGKDFLFCVRPGTSAFKTEYVEKAIANGANCILSPFEIDHPKVCVIPEVEEFYGKLLENFYGSPEKIVKKVGITGTNGKTTISTLIHELMLLEDPQSLLMGTIENRIGKEKLATELTTPGQFALAELIGQAIVKGAHSMVMEVSSHALYQGRIEGLLYDVALFTNLTQDHLDYHGSMENYYTAKKQLFSKYLKAPTGGLVNLDSEWGRKLYEEVPGLSGFSIDRKTDVHVLEKKFTMDKTHAKIMAWGKEFTIESPLVGVFNLENILAFCAAGIRLGFSIERIQRTLKNVQIPGRIERVKMPKGIAYVDYAHTPDALFRVAKTLKEICPGKLSIVFGCGGDRDRTKRPLMAEAAERFGDRVYVTSDNPRTENPQLILEDILRGFDAPQKVFVGEDRLTMIHLACSDLEENDILLVAGKGHEDYQIIGTEKIHFDDRLVLKNWGEQSE